MPSTLVVAGAAFLGGMATSSVTENSTKSRILAHTKTGAMLTRTTLAARKKLGGGAEYDRGFAKGYAECKSKYAAAIAAGVTVPVIPMPLRLGMEPGFVDGYNAGWQKCLDERRAYPSKDTPVSVRDDKPRYAYPSKDTPISVRNDQPNRWYNW
jgi:hypothetical protein